MVEKTELEPLLAVVVTLLAPLDPAPTVTVYVVPVFNTKGDSADAPPPDVPTEVR
jgi:hypothetical protein